MKIKNLVVAKVGEYTDAYGKKVVFTPEELQATAKANTDFHAEGKECPIVLTHMDNDDALKQDLVYGYLKNYRYNPDKQTLEADADIIKGKEKEFTNGKFRNFSMRRATKNKQLLHLAVVSQSAIPACNIRNSQMEELSAQYGEIDSVDFSLERGEMLEKENDVNDIKEETFSDKTVGQKFMDFFSGLFANQKVEIKQEVERALEEFKKPEKVEEEDMEELSALKEELSKKNEELKQYEELKARMEKEKAEFEKKNRENQAAQIFEEFSEKGNVVPCQRELAMKFLLSDMAEDFKAFVGMSKLVDFDMGMETFAAEINTLKGATDADKKAIQDMTIASNFSI